MPKKLDGHNALAHSSVRASQFFLCYCICLTVKARALKFHIWIPHMKIVTPIVSSTEPKDHKEYPNGPASVRPSIHHPNYLNIF